VRVAIDPVYEERSKDDIVESADLNSVEEAKLLARSDYGFFLEHVLGLNTDSELIQEAVDLVNDPPEQPGDATKIAVMAPRGHSKTYSFTVGRALYVALTQESKRIILTSASNSQSKSILERIKRIIERNELLRHLKPNNLEAVDSPALKEGEDAWAAQSIVTTSDVAMLTKTFGSSIRTEHVDYVLADDVLQDSGGNTTREQEKATYYDVVSPIVENKGGVLQVVGTPQSHDDLLMELMDKEAYYSTRYRAFDSETQEPLWEWNWTYEGLMRKKQEIGPARFSREYLCNPMSVEEQYFPYQEAVKPNLDTRFDIDPWRKAGAESHPEWDFYMGADIALSDSAGADFTVITVIGEDASGRCWLVDLHREKGMTPTAIAERISELDSQYAFELGYVEKNAIGEGVFQTIQKRDELTGRILGFDTTRKTRPRILSQLQAALHRNELVLHDHDQLIDEMLAFHNNDGKLEGKAKDDCVLSLAICWEAVEQGDYTPNTATIIGADGSFDSEELDSDEQRLMDMGIV